MERACFLLFCEVLVFKGTCKRVLLIKFITASVNVFRKNKGPFSYMDMLTACCLCDYAFTQLIDIPLTRTLCDLDLVCLHVFMCNSGTKSTKEHKTQRRSFSDVENAR